MEKFLIQKQLSKKLFTQKQSSQKSAKQKLPVLFFLIIATLLITTSAFGSARFQRMVVFGDSLSDTGNLASIVGAFPSPPIIWTGSATGRLPLRYSHKSWA